MGNHRPINIKCWIKFLKAHGCSFTRKKGTSHDKWHCPGCIRSIVFQGALKEIPFFHIQTDLNSMAIEKLETPEQSDIIFLIGSPKTADIKKALNYQGFFNA